MSDELPTLKSDIAQLRHFFLCSERSIMSCSFEIACRVIEALGMNISDFYHGNYSLRRGCL